MTGPEAVYMFPVTDGIKLAGNEPYSTLDGASFRPLRLVHAQHITPAIYDLYISYHIVMVHYPLHH